MALAVPAVGSAAAKDTATLQEGAAPVASEPASAGAQPPSAGNAQPSLAVGTPLQLMLLNEVTSRTAHAGDHFKLRVNEAIVLDGATVVPVGTIAWGEVITLQANGAAGKSGRLGARLLYLDMPTGRVPLEGTIARKGDGNAGGVLMAVVGFGVFGLLAQGDSARLRAGDIFIGTVASKFASDPVSPAPSGTTH